MAARIPKKVAVIGFDAAIPKLLLKHVEEGVLPNFKKLIEEGAYAENCLVPYPTITPPNWTTLATGTWPGTHGITDFHVWKPGNSLGMDGCHQGFNRDDCLVENIWEAAERAGKKSIVLNWPASWPSRLKNGIVVGGNSNIINDWRPVNAAGTEGKFGICSDAVFSTVLFARNVTKIEFTEAEGWKNLPKAKGKEPLEAELTPRPVVPLGHAVDVVRVLGLRFGVPGFLGHLPRPRWHGLLSPDGRGAPSGG